MTTFVRWMWKQKKMQKFALEEPNQTVEIQTTDLQVAKNDLRVVK